MVLFAHRKNRPKILALFNNREKSTDSATEEADDTAVPVIIDSPKPSQDVVQTAVEESQDSINCVQSVSTRDNLAVSKSDDKREEEPEGLIGQDTAHVKDLCVEQERFPDTLTIKQFQEQIFRHNRSFYQDDLARSGRIRLLAVQPGEFSDPLICTLSTRDLTDDLGYEAISYAWGQARRLRYICVNGEPGFEVTENVFFVLRRIRCRERLRVVWVDAICIDQTNALERGHQVGLMGKIYGSASTVLCWLGPCGSTTPGSDELEQCDEHSLSLSDEGPRTPSDIQMDCRDSDWFWAKGTYGKWWDRIWTLQEYCVAKRVQILLGAHSYTPEAFAMALHNYGGPIYNRSKETHFYRSSLSFGNRNVFRRNHQKSGNRERLTLLATLNLSNSCEYTDPKDRIYALLGLCALDPALDPDYKLSTDEVYAQAALRVCQEVGNLNLLICRWRRRKLPTGEPSWIPAWNFPFFLGSGWQRLADEVSMQLEYDWQGNLVGQAAHNFSITGTSIRLTGVRVGRIDSLGRGFDEFEGLEWASIHAGSKLRRAITSTEINGWSRPQRLGAKLALVTETITAHLDAHRNDEAIRSLKRAFVGDQKSVTDQLDLDGKLPWKVPTGVEYLSEASIEAEYISKAYQYLTSCYLLVVDTGHHGISGSWKWQKPCVGDEIALIEGIQAPVILRPYGDSGRYVLVGPAYVQGMMKGEMAQRYQQGQMKKEEFAVVGEGISTVDVSSRHETVWHTLMEAAAGSG